eukprot:g25376.t1
MENVAQRKVMPVSRVPDCLKGSKKTFVSKKIEFPLRPQYDKKLASSESVPSSPLAATQDTVAVPVAACKSVPSSPLAATQNTEALESFEVLSSTNITELTVDEAFEVDVDWEYIRGVANNEPVHFFWGENWRVAEGKGLGGIEDATADNEPKEKGDWGEDRPVAVAEDSMYIYIANVFWEEQDYEEQRKVIWRIHRRFRRYNFYHDERFEHAVSEMSLLRLREVCAKFNLTKLKDYNSVTLGEIEGYIGLCGDHRDEPKKWSLLFNNIPRFGCLHRSLPKVPKDYWENHGHATADVFKPGASSASHFGFWPKFW